MLDSTRDLVLNYELYNANNTAILNTLLADTHQVLRLAENNEWIATNIFRILEVNCRNLYQDLGSQYRNLTNNHQVLSGEISRVLVVLNRMFKAINKSFEVTGTEIINRIFESITITYQLN
jgi:hypothetical protein